LFGERLALDLDNAFYSVAEGLITGFREQSDYEGFKLAVIVNFAIDTSITQDEFNKAHVNVLSDKLYNEAITRYQQKQADIQQQAVPVFKNIRTTQGNHIENVAVPFSDGKKAIEHILSGFRKLIESERELLALSEEASDEGTNSLMSDYIRQQEKLVWMYSAYLK